MVRAAALAAASAAALEQGRRTGTDPGAVSAEVANRLLPHLEADVQLARGVGAGKGEGLATELAWQRHELGRLVEELDRLLLEAGRRQRPTRPNSRAAQTLQTVAALLTRHLTTEDELWTRLGASLLTIAGSAGLADEAAAAERRAAASLRFLWHPPVPPTEATGLRDNPRARRVVILDAAAAARLRARPEPAPRGRMGI